MPELPEVECVRRTLSAHLVGRRISAVRVTRPGVVRGSTEPAALLADDRVADIARHGKQLALIGDAGRCVAIHLGMSGQLCVLPAAMNRSPHTTPTQRTEPPAGSPGPADLPPHTHVLWSVRGGARLRFTDPRRFGGVWTFANTEALREQRWAALGPDALRITPGELTRRLGRTRRGLKAALLDQSLVAGLGNIYVDELLFACGLHPLQPADEIGRDQAGAMVRRMRTLLRGAIERGGSSLRDYVNADAQQGRQQTRHRVYGRAGLACRRRACGQTIQAQQVAGRTTAWCPGCQPRE